MIFKNSEVDFRIFSVNRKIDNISFNKVRYVGVGEGRQHYFLVHESDSREFIRRFITARDMTEFHAQPNILKNIPLKLRENYIKIIDELQISLA